MLVPRMFCIGYLLPVIFPEQMLSPGLCVEPGIPGPSPCHIQLYTNNVQYFLLEMHGRQSSLLLFLFQTFFLWRITFLLDRLPMQLNFYSLRTVLSSSFEKVWSTILVMQTQQHASLIQTLNKFATPWLHLVETDSGTTGAWQKKKYNGNLDGESMVSVIANRRT